MKQPKFHFISILQDAVETMRSVSLNFKKKNDLLSGKIPCLIASVSSSREALSVTPGPSHSRLMTELNLHPEPSY